MFFQMKGLVNLFYMLFSDPNTIFRGNTLASKCMDELMKLVGFHYLHDTLKGIIDKVGI